MPELPEVETVVRDLRQLLLGQAIGGVEVFWERTVATPAPAEFAARLAGQRILGADRRGKYIILRLDQDSLVVHLRMTGQLLVVPLSKEAGHEHLRVALELSDSRLLFVDTRKFGRMYLVRDAAQIVGKLGPEPLGSSFTVQALAESLRGRRGAIKPLLLNQQVVAGIGNIYADEALFVAGILPSREAGSLAPAEVESLHAAIRSELARGIRNRGTTLSDYRDAGGRPGEHQSHLCVYGRAGEPCPRCGTEIARARLGGRSSCFCPHCQG